MDDSTAVALKEKCDGVWLSDYCTDVSGFSALPGGNRGNCGGNFYDIRQAGYWWQPDSINGAPSIAEARALGTTNPDLVLLGFSFYYGLSVRCVKE
jgi:uncharacterized protein (TIGR02145 family)